VFEQVLEGEEGMAHAGLSPIQKYAATSGDNDISRIAVEATEGIWDSALRETRK
jgi:hypothetical protein